MTTTERSGHRAHLFVGLAMLVLASRSAVAGVTVEGVSYPDTATVAGQELELVGAGLREKWFVDVYTLGAYSASGSCNPRALSRGDEVKYLRIDMLRNVSAERLANSLRKQLFGVMPDGARQELRKQVNTFLSYLRDAKEDMRIEVTYVPGQGTQLRQGGKESGPAQAGKPFADLLWSAYFGDDTCCSDLKEQILQGCTQRGTQ